MVTTDNFYQQLKNNQTIMTAKYKQIRDKQIRKAAKSYFDKIYDYENNRRDYRGSAYDEGYLDALDQVVETAFIAGAMWADEHPDGMEHLMI